LSRLFGPLKSAASNAILTLPPFAVQTLRRHRHQQLRLRLAMGQPATVGLRWVEPGRPPHPVELDLVFRTERGTPVNPNHASRAFARLAASVGLVAHPHMPRHALASAMAANKEPASIIAAQLRHADGGALAHDWATHGRIVAGQGLCGRDRIRTCVGNAGVFPGRIGVSARVLSHPAVFSIIARDVRKQPIGSFRRPSGSLAVPPHLLRPSVGKRGGGGKGPEARVVPTPATPNPGEVECDQCRRRRHRGHPWLVAAGRGTIGAVLGRLPDRRGMGLRAAASQSGTQRPAGHAGQEPSAPHGLTIAGYLPQGDATVGRSRSALE
jgi:hypothetical protein